MQVLPNVDSFDAGSPAYDSGVLTSYIRALPITLDPAYGSGGSGFALSLASWSNAAKLYSGWSASGGTNGNPAPAANTIEDATGTNAPTGWLWRDFTHDDVAATLTVQLVSSNPLIETTPRKFYVGVIGRAQGGTLQSGATVAARIEGGSCYMAVGFFDPALGGKFQILRVNNGVVTRLAETPAGAGTFMTWDTFAPTLQRQYTLEIENTPGGDVSLDFRMTVSTRVAPTTLLSYIDTTAVVKILTPGRCGFFMGSERVESSIVAAPCATYFEAGVLDDPPTIRDEWTRMMPAASRLVTTPAFFVGRALTCMWEWDLWRGNFAGANVMLADTASDRVKFDGTSAAVNGWQLSQRVATSGIHQDRKATFQFKSGVLVPNPSRRSVGIVVRGTHVTPGLPLDSGYWLEAQRDDQAVTTQLRLWRQLGGVSLLIADLTGLTIAMDTDFELRLAITNKPFPDPLTGDVVLRVYLDGLQQVMTLAPSPPAGITVDANGVVVDSTSSRITSGLGEGLYLVNPNGSLRLLTLDAWAEGDTIVDPDPNPNDEPGIDVAGEADVVSLTLTLPESWGVQEVKRALSVIHPVETGQRYVSPRHTRARRRWRVSVRAAPEADMTAFRDFVASTKGVQVPFNWTPPKKSAAVVVHFVDPRQVDELMARDATGLAYSYDFELEELYATQ